MRKSVLIIGTLLLLGGIAFVANNPRIIAPTPNLTALPPVIQGRSSSVQIELSGSLSGLEQSVNQKFENHRSFRGTKENPTSLLTEDTLTWRVNVGHVKLFPVDGELGIAIPIESASVSVQGVLGVKRKNKGPLGWFEKAFSTSFSETANFAGQIVGTANPAITEDWKINPNINLDVQLSKAEAHLFGKAIKVSFRSEIRDEINTAARRIAHEMNEEISANEFLQAKVSRVWKKLHVSEMVSDDPPLWVSVKPTSIGITVPNVQGDKFSIVLEATVENYVHVSESAPAVTLTELPAMKSPAEPGRGFEFNIPVTIALDQFDGISPNELSLPDTFETGAGQVMVKRIFLGGDDGQLYIGVDLRVSTGVLRTKNIRIFAKGRPRLSENQEVLRIEELRYDIETENLLVEVADWLLEPFVLNRLERYAVFDLGEMRNSIFIQAEEMIDRGKLVLPKGVDLDVSLANAQLANVSVDDGWLIAVLNVSGALRIFISEIPGELAVNLSQTRKAIVLPIRVGVS